MSKHRAGRGAIEPGPRRPPNVCFRSNLRGHNLRRLARQPALSAALDRRAVLGRQRHRRPPRRRAYSAGDAGVPALGGRVSDRASVRVEASGARLGGDSRPPRHHGPVVRDRHRRLQRPAILGARIHPGAEHAAAAVGRAAVRRGMVAALARGPADAGAGRRNCIVADRRAGDPAARRPHRSSPASCSTRATSSSPRRW